MTALVTVECVSLNSTKHSTLIGFTSGLCGTFCFPCQTYKNAEALDHSGILCCLLSLCLPCISTCILRGRAREKYNIEVGQDTLLTWIIINHWQGSVCGDCSAALCCNECVSCQIAVEIKEKKQNCCQNAVEIKETV